MTAPLNLFPTGSLFGSAVSGLDAPIPNSPDDWLVDNTPQGDVSQLKNGVQPTTKNEPHTVEAPPAAAIGGSDQISQALDNAHQWLGTMYDWGGNGQNGRGVDCSGLVYAAFKSAGFNIQRYRAVDYGHMGHAVSVDQARPGDIVYFDEPGDTDHVGIYLGSGKFIESPTQGQRVQISNLRSGAQLRRIFGGTSDLTQDATGATQYHSPDSKTYTASALSPQRDPLEQLSALDTDANSIIKQHIEQQQQGSDTAKDVPRSADAKAQGTDTNADNSYLGKVMNALAGQESGGDYNVVNSIGARGKYQVMTANVGTWSQQVLGRRITPAEFSASPDLQERIVRGIFGGYVSKYGLRGALAAWYSGKPGRESDYSSVRGGPSVGAYVDQVIARMK